MPVASDPPRNLNWMAGIPAPISGGRPQSIGSVWSADMLREQCSGAVCHTAADHLLSISTYTRNTMRNTATPHDSAEHRITRVTALTPLRWQVHAFITDQRATIVVPGLTKPLKLLHLSDSHVDGGIDTPSFGEAGYEQSAFFMNELYAKGLADRCKLPMAGAPCTLSASCTLPTHARFRAAKQWVSKLRHWVDRSSGAMGPTTTDIFRGQVAAAAEDGTDLIIHTGIIVCNADSDYTLSILYIMDSMSQIYPRG